uniref:Serpentine receptor class gamma n=1 Tax=Meloidogyne hapla TaxID=6305 RepID=A0A1I8C2S1_MELHA
MVKKKIGVVTSINGNKNNDDKIQRRLWFIALLSSFGQMLMAIVVSLIYAFDSYYGFRIPNIFPNMFLANPYPEWILAIFVFFINYSMLGENLATFCIMLNRFTAVSWPIKHQIVG